MCDTMILMDLIPWNIKDSFDDNKDVCFLFSAFLYTLRICDEIVFLLFLEGLSCFIKDYERFTGYKFSSCSEKMEELFEFVRAGS